MTDSDLSQKLKSSWDHLLRPLINAGTYWLAT